MLKYLTIGIIFLLGFCISGNKAAGSEKNLLKNSGFEIDTNRNEIPDRWSFEGRRQSIKVALLQI